MKVALCCIGRLENRYAVEYVEYYKSISVDKIFIYDNNYDGEEHFEDVLQPYIDDGLVEIIDFRNKSVCQLEAYQDCYDRHGNEYDWICFFDFDEYIWLENLKTLKELLSLDIYTNYELLHINELIYGDSGNLRYENKPLIERFKTPVMPINYKKTFDFPENCHVKSIIKGGLNGIKWSGTPHTPTNDLKCCNSSGEPCKSSSPFVIPYSFKNACLRHFKTKTIEEYYETKVRRGYPDGNKNFFEKNSWIEEFFTENEKTFEKMAFIRELTHISNINVMIVNFNTQILTDACIESINKHTKNVNIYIFDNSDKEPYVNTFANVTVMDNTKGQIIDFNKWLDGYPVKNPMGNNYGSAKHCYTIQKFMDIFDDNFILMDSDIIVKQDIISLYDDRYIFVADKIGNFAMWGPRLLPYICFINNKMCKENGIRFFDDTRMAQLNNDNYNDTGASFLEDASKYPHRFINYKEYVEHLAAGSWANHRPLDFVRKNINYIRYDGKITVVIPCYNQGKYVKETIESVKKSTYEDFYCVIVNDGSTDNSEEEILSAISGDCRFRYFKTENNGVGHARNIGISKSDSKYILCLDSDDKVSPTYIENGVKFLDKYDEFVLYYGRCNFFYDDGKEIEWDMRPYSYKALLKCNIIYCSHIFRRTAYNISGGYDEKLGGYEDWEFLIRLLNNTSNVYRCNDIVFYYRRHLDSRDHQAKLNYKKYLVEIFKKNKSKFESNNLILNI